MAPLIDPRRHAPPMSSTPTISVITPLYNESEQVAHFLHHLADLTGWHETILIDASTTPAARTYITRLRAQPPPAVTVLTSPTAGRAVQMNLGAQHASGTILLFLHCDTRLPPRAMQQIKTACQSGTVWGRFCIRLDAAGGGYRLIATMMNLRSRLRRLATGDQAMFVTAAQFAQSGGFPTIALMEDIALSTTLGRHAKPALIPDAVTTSARRWQQRGLITTILLMWKIRLCYWLGVSPTRLNQWYRDAR